ncbi:MAG TPA: hypothetical protein VHH11_13775 [Gammaproteobacteria bacterium]|nr:hypothetical protein [Gammaproteobacteria bacterium]
MADGNGKDKAIYTQAQFDALDLATLAVGFTVFISDAGTVAEVTLDDTGAKRWQLTQFGAGVQVGASALVAGTKTIDTGVTITAASKVFVTRQGAPGGGTAIGLLNVRAVTPGAPGVGSFVVESLAEANQALVAADTSAFVFCVVG